MPGILHQLTTANKWRAAYNPLRGLTIQRAVSLLDDGERGAYADLQAVYRLAERRHPTLRGLKRRRLAAMGKLDTNFKRTPTELLPPGATDKMADAQLAYLRQRYDAIDNLREAIRFLALAEFRGYSFLEAQKLAEVSGQRSAVSPATWSDVNHFDTVDHWFWCRDGIYAPWTYNADQASGRVIGTPVDGYKLIRREVEDPINEIALINFVRSGLCDKDWDAYIEIYGLARPIVIMPPNIPTGKEDEYRDAAESIADGQGGALPNGGDAKFPTEMRGNQPFLERLKRLDEQLVLAGTGGKLTMLSEATGIGGGASDIQADVFQDIAINEAMEISEIFQKQFDKPLLNEKFPGQPILAYFEIAATEETDIGQIVDHAAKLSVAGYRISAEELSEKTGYDLADAPVQSGAAGFDPNSDTVIQRRLAWEKLQAEEAAAKPSLANRIKTAWRVLFHSESASSAKSAVNSDADRFASALSADLAPFRQKYGPLLNRLETALAMAPEYQRAEIEALKPELEAMLADTAIVQSVLKNSHGAETLEKLLAKEFFNALEENEAPRARLANREDGGGRWITVEGRPIYLREGQTVSEKFAEDKQRGETLRQAEEKKAKEASTSTTKTDKIKESNESGKSDDQSRPPGTASSVEGVLRDADDHGRFSRADAARATQREAYAARNADLDELDRLAEANPKLVRNPAPARAQVGGQEHVVQFNEQTGRVDKFSNGLGLIAGNDGLHPATVKQYRERIALQNEYFATDIKVEGIMREKGGMTGIATSMRLAKGVTPKEAEVTSFMQRHGFEPMGGKTSFYNRADKVLVTDAKPDNFKRDKQGRIMPVDLIIQRTEDAALLKFWGGSK